MTLYILVDQTVTARSSALNPLPPDAVIIETAEQLAASRLTLTQMVALWNELPGATPVSRFRDRKTAAQRLWAAFGRLPVDLEPVRPRRSGPKQAEIIDLLKRPEGATIEEMALAVGWQRHTVRGMISGTLKKKLGLSVLSEKTDRGRLYRIIGQAAAS